MIESPTLPEPQPSKITVKHLQPEFHGTASEYFKIWIVNTLLTVITLGFYLPWAKVRTRRYFYLNTTLDKEPFDYLADPKRLLYGYLIVAAFLLAYNFLPTFNPILALPIIIAGAALFPWVIYKSRRFFCHNSAYRNVRFRFLGEISEAYKAYLGYPILASMTLGIIWPLALFKQREFFFSNVAFGNVSSSFSGRSGYFYKVYLSAFAIMFVLIIAMSFAIAGLSIAAANGNVEEPSMAIMLMPMAFYAVFFLIYQITNILITNYCWNNTRFPGHMDVICNINPFKYTWIQFSNILAIIVSLGFLMPWAKVRLYNYRLSCFSAAVSSEMENVIAVQQAQDDGAMGDMAADQFDFEIGL